VIKNQVQLKKYDKLFKIGINLSLTAPAALIALALIHLKSNN
jgi:hypothetical protein